MKKTTLHNIFLISSFLLFTACSTKEIKPRKQATQPSVYNLMGIPNPKKEIVHFIIKDAPHVAQAVPHTPQIHLSPKIEVAPEVQAAHEVHVSPDIEFISYRQNRETESFESNEFSDLDTYSLEEDAKSFLGTPYVWGATGPDKFDCSGFTQWVFRDAGITIPRVSREQAKVGEYVRYDDLQRGDMVFFATKKHQRGKVTHVGIYLGNGDFIHASSAGKKVVIYNFNKKSFYKKHFLWGRRLSNTNMHYASN